MKKSLPPFLQFAKLRAARRLARLRADRKRKAEDRLDPIYHKAQQERDRLRYLARAGGYTPEHSA